MKQTIYLSSAYLAPVEYYARLYSCEKAFIEQHDNYIKQPTATDALLHLPMAR